LIVRSHRKRVLGGKEGLVGEKGEAKGDLIPNREGKVFVHGELWNAIAKEEIKRGEKIVVEKVEGMMLVVRGFKKGE
jgi:membrane-bound serine protease (ClpP class)